MVELEEGEFFDWQLEGCSVETIDGQRIGEAKELMRDRRRGILVVTCDKEYLVPFADNICIEVDVENKRIDHCSAGGIAGVLMKIDVLTIFPGVL